MEKAFEGHKASQDMDGREGFIDLMIFSWYRNTINANAMLIVPFP